MYLKAGLRDKTKIAAALEQDIGKCLGMIFQFGIRVDGHLLWATTTKHQTRVFLRWSKGVGLSLVSWKTTRKRIGKCQDQQNAVHEAQLPRLNVCVDPKGIDSRNICILSLREKTIYLNAITMFDIYDLLESYKIISRLENEMIFSATSPKMIIISLCSLAKRKRTQLFDQICNSYLYENLDSQCVQHFSLRIGRTHFTGQVPMPACRLGCHCQFFPEAGEQVFKLQFLFAWLTNLIYLKSNRSDLFTDNNGYICHLA